jgi:peroxiredoxin family protein
MIKEIDNQNIRQQYQNTINRTITTKKQYLSIIITEDTYDKALTAFNLAVSAIEMGIDVNMFFTSRGVNIIKKSYKPRKAKWAEAPIAWKESFIKKRGGATLAQLMYQAKDMGVSLSACYTSMLSMGLHPTRFIEGVTIKRMPEILQKNLESDTHLLIG